MNGIGTALDALLSALFPPRCAACDARGAEPFCRVCRDAIDPCGSVGRVDADWAYAEFEYGGALAEAICRMKYGGRWEIARPLGALMYRSVALAPVTFDLVVPVPSTPERLRARGYNPARELARAWGRDVRAGAARRRPGPAQVGRSRRERRSNLRGAFVAEPRLVRGRRVLVVDDVITTGATASAMVDELRRCGAVAVGIAALASASG